MLTPHDLEILAKRGISEEQLNEQVNRFKTGFPYLHIASSARVGNGIVALTADEQEKAMTRWEQFLADGGDVAKFVPASGAASRMFKALFTFADGDSETPAPDSDVAKIIDNIDRLAFYKELDDVMNKIHGIGVKELIAAGRYKDVIKGIIAPDGLNYGNLPKGLLSFHAYPGGSVRTPVEEQLMEGAQTATGADGTVNIHFTVSANHRDLFEKKLADVIPALEKKMGVTYNVTMSEQKPATDTVAVNPDNSLFREDGQLVFRPGGHGALIQNLNDINATVVFIKNIDNVVTDSHRESTLVYKKVLAGYLIELHDIISSHLTTLATGNYTRDNLNKMLEFAERELSIHNPEASGLDDDDLAAYLESKFDRPLRVAGMVRNEGEPGGGPYLARNPDGTTSPQVLESTQIDPDNAEYAEIVKTATHFNPVDLVCYIKDTDGVHYYLPDYVDPATGFISEKSLHGHPLRALELPGLWNGAMSDWTTVFVEVPVSTFNPVKTVNDLLREAHRN